MAGEEGKVRFLAAMFAVSLLLVGLVAMPAKASPSAPGSTCGLTASVSVDPTSGDAGTQAIVSGSNYCTGTTVNIRFWDADGVMFPLVGHLPVASDGTFSVTVTIPNDAAIGVGIIRGADKASQQCPTVLFEVTAPG
jgi:hypothetical protein